jgi:hypothetical protein
MPSLARRSLLGHTSRGDDGADLGELDKDDVAERLLGVVGDADRRDIGRRVDGRPLVVRCVLVGCRKRDASKGVERRKCKGEVSLRAQSVS